MQTSPTGSTCILDSNKIYAYSAIMELRKTLPFKFFWVLVLLVCVSASTKETDAQGCSIEDIDFGLCLNQRNIPFSIDSSCCKVLNKVVQAGFNCLCLLVASSFPLSSTPVSLPLSNCFITVPPLSLCKVAAPTPIVFPPDSQNQVRQPLPPPQENSSEVMATQPPDGLVSPPQTPSTSPTNVTNTMAATQPSSTDKASPQPTCLSGKNNEMSGKQDTVAPNLVLVLSSLFLYYIYALKR